MAEYIEKEAALEVANGWREQLIPTYGENDEYVKCLETVAARLYLIPAADVRPVPNGGIGEMSDGYHTFNGLYYQRMVLFAALVKAHKDCAWKSLRHEDGELCFGGGWFIVGIDTPEGSYTYHYEEKDWDLFDCVELPVAKHWDGHTEKDVTRLLSLDVSPVVRGRWIDTQPDLQNWQSRKNGMAFYCSACKHRAGKHKHTTYQYCPWCGAKMEVQDDR